MATENNKAISLGEIVANDFRAASVFKSNRIDFCCGGRKSLEQFEDDLHIHVHLENNILYPSALKLTI